MRFWRACGDDTAGASAVEYALIGGLVGLGLIGSLVTTRASLSATLGTAATQMQSGVSAPAAPGSAVPIFDFGAKTVSKRTVYSAASQGRTDGVSTYQDRFSDGSYLSWSPASSTVPEEMSFSDATQTPYAQTFYYSAALAAQNAPETLVITGVPANGQRTDTTVTFAADGTAAASYRTFDTATGQTLSTATAAGRRSDYAYALAPLSVARTLPTL